MRFKLIMFLWVSTALHGTAQDSRGKLDSYFTQLFQTGQFNGNVLVAENGRVVYEKSFGYADFSGKAFNKSSTSFPVASVTKTITATAILQLQEKRKLDINDAFVKYFPAFPYPAVTIRQLLSHTSLLPSSGFYRLLDSLSRNKDTFFTNKDVIPALLALNKPMLKAAQGDRGAFAYSNLNYYLLALLIEKLSGMAYSDYIKQNIFDPAGMKHSSFSDFYFGKDKNLSREHRYRYYYSPQPERIDTVAENQKIFKTYNFKGHGDVISTTGDLLKYSQALYNGTLLNNASLSLAYHAVVPGTPATSGYGLGWSILHDSSGGKTVQHHGGGLGIEVMLVRNIAKRQTIILFDNMRNPAFYTAVNALRILNGDYVPAPKRNIAKLYASTIVKEGIPAAQALLQKLLKDTANYSMNEDGMNLMAYQLLWADMNDKALEAFKANLQLFPGSWNSYDSYGEALLKVGRKDEAIQMYKRSIELNPANEGGKKVLEELLKF